MRFHQANDVGQAFDSPALSGLGLGPGFDLAPEGVLQRGYPHENPMHIGRDSTGREITVEIFRAELNTDRGVSLEVDGPFEFLRSKPGLLKKGNGPLNGFDGNYKTHVLGHHELLGPMVDRDGANDAPGYIGSLKAIDEPHDIIRPAPRLPIVELLSRHGDNDSLRRAGPSRRR